MLYPFILLSLATHLFALPLNINLGAYSPAIVVGDGEISFGGKEDVVNLIAALEGAGVNAAAANGETAAVNIQQAQQQQQQQQQQQEQAQPTKQSQATTLQGIGKEIAPRIRKIEAIDKETRELTGLESATAYATDALTTGPKMQLGTGECSSGVGIIQDADISAPAARALAARHESIVARTHVGNSETRLRTTDTTMFVRGGPVGSAASLSARNVEDAAPSASQSSGIDGVNLNVAEGQLIELIFVDTKPIGEDDGDDDDGGDD